VVLVDTSVWIDHLKRGNPGLVALLDQSRVCCHPMVLGELACGNMSHRSQVLGLLAELPRAECAAHDEAMSFIDANGLSGLGLGFIDIHLLASARLSSVALWTLVVSLDREARRLGIGFSPLH